MNNKENITYQSCGIEDVERFYRSKFAGAIDYDYTIRASFEHNILFFKQNFIIDYIRSESKVLDFGCGSGSLGVIKKLGCELTGVDYSKEALAFAKELNHYDRVLNIDIFDKEIDPFKHYFDHIVSLDVFGHIEFGKKDQVIRRLKEFLKPDGVMIHGIEAAEIDYFATSDNERKKFVGVDGHVGIEPPLIVKKRFEEQFKYVNLSNSFVFNSDLFEVIKQNDSYGRKYDQELIEYLKSMVQNRSFNEGFNIGQFLSQRSIISSRVDLSHFGGFCFVMASDKELVTYPNKLPRPKVQFSCDFYDPEISNDGIFRWAPASSMIFLNSVDQIEIKLSSYFPMLSGKEQTVYIYIDDELAKKVFFTPQKCEKRLKMSDLTKKRKMVFCSDSIFSPEWFGYKDSRLLSFMLTIMKVK